MPLFSKFFSSSSKLQPYESNETPKMVSLTNFNGIQLSSPLILSVNIPNVNTVRYSFNGVGRQKTYLLKNEIIFTTKHNFIQTLFIFRQLPNTFFNYFNCSDQKFTDLAAVMWENLHEI